MSNHLNFHYAYSYCSYLQDISLTILFSVQILFVKLTNTKGSTVESPTVVETSIVLAVGNNQPSVPRLNQLAQNIQNSSAGNLGLNHTAFGRVKQIRLSSFLQHSLSSGVGSSLAPSTAPQPSINSHLHSNHQHDEHQSNVHTAPAPSPKPTFTHLAPTPSRSGFSTNTSEIVPIAAPAAIHYLSATSFITCFKRQNNNGRSMEMALLADKRSVRIGREDVVQESSSVESLVVVVKVANKRLKNKPEL
ncbi:hypothetical protein KSP39_PZI007910 [Platanthera zijinensis]|uniref:DUF7036 domain-containing protein n=1 Tax=Platanthera zijinensis TaxID=2320716 RepID=A0AAP0G8N3_9ASPA